MKKSWTTFNDEIDGAHCDNLFFFFFLIWVAQFRCEYKKAYVVHPCNK